MAQIDSIAAITVLAQLCPRPKSVGAGLEPNVVKDIQPGVLVRIGSPRTSKKTPPKKQNQSLPLVRDGETLDDRQG